MRYPENRAKRGEGDPIKRQRDRRRAESSRKVFEQIQLLIAQGVKFFEPWSKSGGAKPWRGIGYKVNEKGCWICVTHKPSSSGYPRIRRNGKLVHVSIYVYERLKGPVPAGLCLMHKCDNKLCINSDHLEIGTLAQNTKDEWDRGLLPWRRKNVS